MRSANGVSRPHEVAVAPEFESGAAHWQKPYGERCCATCEYFRHGNSGVGKCEQFLVNIEAKAYACEWYELGTEEAAGVGTTADDAF